LSWQDQVLGAEVELLAF